MQGDRAMMTGGDGFWERQGQEKYGRLQTRNQDGKTIQNTEYVDSYFILPFQHFF